MLAAGRGHRVEPPRRPVFGRRVSPLVSTGRGALAWSVALASRHDEVTPAHNRADQPFVAQNREGAFRGALGYLELLSNRARRRHPAGQGAALDLAAEDSCHLEVERSRRFVINSHVIMLGTYRLTCAFRCTYRNL